MAFLLPCPSCARHVRRTESSCPFCASALAFGDAPAPRLPTERLGRAATFAFGAAVATSALTGCSGSVTPAYGAPAPDTGLVDSGSITPAYGHDGSFGDAGTDAATPETDSGSPALDASDVDAGGSSSDYGAPPPP